MSSPRRLTPFAFAVLAAALSCTNPNERAAFLAARLAVVTPPGNSVSGVVLTTQPVIEIRDSHDQKVGGDTAEVTAAIAIGSGTLMGTTTVKAVDGVATFTDLAVNGAGSQVIGFASQGLDGATAGLSVAQPPGATPVPASLSIQVQPAGAISGTPFASQPVVRILDNAGLLITNGPGATASVSVTRTSGTGALSGTTTVTAVGGVATFTDLAITGAGFTILTFSITSPSVQVLSNTFMVGTSPPGPATQLAIVTQPQSATSGVPFSTAPLVEVRDANGNAAASTADVTIAIGSGSGSLVGTTTVQAVNGVATFGNLRINGSGPHTLVVTSSGLTGATSNSFQVNQVAASLVIQTQPSNATSGQTFPTAPVIEVLDNAGLLVDNSSLAVTVARSSGTGTLSGTTTVNAVNGVATFSNLTITGTGTHKLTFSATGIGSVTSTSFSVTSALGPATAIAITSQPNGSVSGTPFTTQPVVELRDANGSIVTAAGNAVTATIASGSGTLSGTTTVSAVNGVATFTNLAITGSGSHSLTFSATGLTSATSAPFSVSSGVGAASKLAITTQPAGATSGVAFTTQPVVQIRDANNALVATATDVVTAAIATGTGTLSGTTTVSAVNGVATFTNLAITGSGNQTIVFTAPGLTSATSGTISLGGTATKLAMSVQPSTSAQNGVAFTTQPAVRLRDAANTNVSQAGVVVTAAIASGGGTLNGTKTATTDANGVATFTNLSITGTTGSRTLRFTATALTNATSGSISLTAGPPSQLTITTQPDAATQSGAVLSSQPVVQLRDVSGNAVSQGGVTVTATMAGGSATLGGSPANTNAVGAATFTDLSLTGAVGKNTLRFDATSLTGVVSDTVSIAGPPTQLAITRQPSGAFTGVSFGSQPIVEVRDALGNRVGNSTAAVTATLTSGTGVLSGTATVNAVNGVATFSNLAITGTGSFSITFSSSGLTSISTSPFTVSNSGLASHDFNNGSGGPFDVLGSIPSNVTFPDDPTGSGRGKVAQFRYNGTGHNQDLNLALNYMPNGFGLGSTFYFRGDLYFPASTANFNNGQVQRKLLYFRREGGDPRYVFAVLHLWGTELNVEYSADGSDSPQGFAGSITAGKWYRIEMQITMNSSMSSQDGIMRVWVDGVQTYQKTNVRFTNPGWSGDVSWKYWWFGMQRESTEIIGGPQEPSIDEVRYWDNVTYSTARVP